MIVIIFVLSIIAMIISYFYLKEANRILKIVTSELQTARKINREVDKKIEKLENLTEE